MFQDRIEAGNLLAEKLIKFKGEEVVVLAIPRGGLPLGAIIAKTLHAPLDVALTKKIGHPYHKEYAIGAVSLENMVLNNAIGIPQEYIDREVTRIRKKLQLGHSQYYKHRSPKNLRDKTVIIVDDGIATGNTVLATVQLVDAQKPKKIVVATPVAPGSAVTKLENSPKVAEFIYLQAPLDFRAVGQFYQKFEQVSDGEAIRFLTESNS